MSDVYMKPGQGRVDSTEETKFDTSPRTRNTAAAQSQHAENLERGMQDAIAAVKVATPDRDASQNARFRYERNYERLRQAVRLYVLQTGKQVSVPAYLPPPAKQEQFTRFGPADFPVDVLGQYSETGGRGKSTGAQPDFSNPESDAHQAWLSTQGAAPVDTTGMSPDDAGRARRKRAGVQS